MLKIKKNKLKIKYILFFLFININNNNIHEHKINEEKFDSYDVAFNKAKEFINNNINGLLMSIEKSKISKNPNISIVIPCYNCKKFILRAIRSIQNQNFSNFEIVISNDGSTEDTLLFIEQLQKEENRIRIINNKIFKYGIIIHKMYWNFSIKRKIYIAYG